MIEFWNSFMNDAEFFGVTIVFTPLLIVVIIAFIMLLIREFKDSI